MSARRRIGGAFVATALALASLSAISPASAKPPKGIEVTSTLSTTEVEVGDTVTVTLRMKGDGISVGSPSLKPPPELNIVGSNLIQHTYMMGRHIEMGVDATWELIASRVGHYSIPAPTAFVNGTRVAGTVMTIDVVAPTGKRKSGRQNNPFNFPGMPGGKFNIPWPFGNDVEPDDEAPASSRPDLDLAQAPDPLAFVRALVDKKEAMVGEQVTVSYYLYCRFACEYREPGDPGYPDFRRIPLDRNKTAEPVGTATVGGQRFATQLLAKMALFPLRAGDLKVGAMKVSVTGKRFGHAMEERESDEKALRVLEPPLANRPPGYVVGDVGQYTITATVQPRKIDLDGSVAVTVHISGTGFVPDAVHVPEKRGIEWLDPEKKELIDVQAGKVAGSRTFGYVVKLKNSGEVDLGSVDLPFWDPSTKKYAVATAPLGEVEVNGVASPNAPSAPKAAASPDDLFGTLPPTRKTLAPWAASAPSRLFSGSRFWGLLVSPPLGVALAWAGVGAVRELRKRRGQGKTSPRAAAERALEQARAAAAANTPKELAAALERACHAAIESSFGLKSRGVLLGELGPELVKRGAPEVLAARVGELLAACDAIRFDPNAESSSRDLLAPASETVAELLRTTRREAASGAT